MTPGTLAHHLGLGDFFDDRRLNTFGRGSFSSSKLGLPASARATHAMPSLARLCRAARSTSVPLNVSLPAVARRAPISSGVLRVMRSACRALWIRRADSQAFFQTPRPLSS